jgi:phage portal protein BeeE
MMASWRWKVADRQREGEGVKNASLSPLSFSSAVGATRCAVLMSSAVAKKRTAAEGEKTKRRERGRKIERERK